MDFVLGKDEKGKGFGSEKMSLGEEIKMSLDPYGYEYPGIGFGLGKDEENSDEIKKQQEYEERFDRDFEELFGVDPEFKVKVKAQLALAKAFVEQTSDSEDTDYEEEDCGGGEEEEEEEEEDWKKGKSKEEQCQMLIDTFQNKHLFKSDTDVLSEDEFGEHEMTYQEFVKYNFEIDESGGFEVSSYPDVFACGMIMPYFLQPDFLLTDEEREELTSFAQQAIAKYNRKKNTSYGNVTVLKANSQDAGGMNYYITFVASNDYGARTFQSKVYQSIPRFGKCRTKICLVRRSRMSK